MYSPQDRIYTTPDMSVPSVYTLIQRLRLESILRRSGFFSYCKPYWQPLPNIERGVRLPHIRTDVEPFGIPERKDTKRSPPSKSIKGQENRGNRVTLPSIKQKQQTKDHKTKRHTCRESEDASVQHHSAAVAKGCNYAQFPYCAKPEIYKPFHPQKPVKLPSIQGESSTKKVENQTKTSEKSPIKCVMCAQLQREAKKEDEKWKNPEKELIKRKRQRKREQEFREWSESRDNYYGKSLDIGICDSSIFERQEKMHDIDARRKKTEDIHRQVGLTYINIGTSNFQRHMESLPKIEKKKTVKKSKKTKTINKSKKPKSDFKHIL